MATKKKQTDQKQEQSYDDIVEISTEAEQEADSRKQSEAAPAGSTSLNDRIDELEGEKQELSDRLLRTMAEFDNYRKRVIREKEGLVKYGTEKIAADILQVVDNFERAVDQARDAEEIGPVVDGIELILKQLVSTLEKYHVTAFASVGEQFDPEKHEAMAQQEHPDCEENTVIAELQKGYFLGEKLLRPARVIVSRTPVDAAPEDKDDELQ